MGQPRILKILESYRNKNSHIPIVVEGKHDVESLRKIEFPGQIITLNSGSSLLSFSEGLSREYGEVILLTDFDRRGIMLKSEIEAFLRGSGCKPDTELWSSIRRMVPVRTVEELPFAISRIIETQNY